MGNHSFRAGKKKRGFAGKASSCDGSHFFALDLIVRHMVSFASPF